MSIFPFISPRSGETEPSRGLYLEVAWDFVANAPIYKNGEPVVVSGKEAVLVWAWNALHTPRHVHEIFTRAYGCEAKSLIGRPFSDGLKQSEAARFVSECLLINPYISHVKNIQVEFVGDLLSVSCTIVTVYGEVSLDV
ncbi:MAG: DUF2634 domain-containing protein [Oscillospiraceae bacterium]|nr:DUF2634 domain-containing protein [Oscillospiraceae bacterium]